MIYRMGRDLESCMLWRQGCRMDMIPLMRILQCEHNERRYAILYTSPTKQGLHYQNMVCGRSHRL